MVESTGVKARGMEQREGVGCGSRTLSPCGTAQLGKWGLQGGEVESTGINKTRRAKKHALHPLNYGELIKDLRLGPDVIRSAFSKAGGEAQWRMS